MTRVVRIFAVVALAVAMLLPLAAAAMWYRSRRTSDTFTLKREHTVSGRFHVTAWSVESGRGVVALVYYDVDVGLPRSAAVPLWRQFSAQHSGRSAQQFELPQTSAWERAGFGRQTDVLTSTNVGNTSGITRVWWMPYWALLLALLVFPVMFPGLVAARRRYRRRVRARRGECVGCGYDLRGTSGHCPSCGIELPNGRADEPCVVCGCDLSAATWRCPECGLVVRSATRAVAAR